MTFALNVYTQPTEEPVTLPEAKEHLRIIDDTSQDTKISSLITVAREWCEEFTCRSLVSTIFDLTLDCFPDECGGEIRLPRSKVQSVQSVKYYDTDGTLQTMDAADYFAALAGEPGRIVPALNTFWPVTRDLPEQVIVRFTAGYGDADDVPKAIKQAMLLLIGSMYENREDEVTGTITQKLKGGAENLLWPYRVLELY
jgi:uncharacterized phiE125 gp8 family phage protein